MWLAFCFDSQYIHELNEISLFKNFIKNSVAIFYKLIQVQKLGSSLHGRKFKRAQRLCVKSVSMYIYVSVNLKFIETGVLRYVDNF